MVKVRCLLILLLCLATGYAVAEASFFYSPSSGSGASVSDEEYAGTWDGVTDAAPSKNTVYDKIETLAGGHAAVTLAADAATVFGLSTQELTLDTQLANYVFAGPTTGAAADPTFRALVADDIPDLSGTYLTAETDPVVGAVTGLVLADGIGGITATADNTSNWDTAYGWGDHSGAGYAISGGAEHDTFSDFVTNEHIDWTSDQGATNIHTGNYANTTYTASGTLLDLTGTAFSVLAGTLTTTKGCKFVTGTGLVCDQDYLLTETDPTALLTAGTNNVTDLHIDWGSGANQVDLDDVPDSATYAKLTVTKDGYIDQDVGSGASPTLDGTNFSGISELALDDINAGDTYTNYGLVSDDTLNELFAAIDSAFGDLPAGHDALTLSAFADEFLSLTGQELTLQLTDPNADRLIMWDDVPGDFVWVDHSGWDTNASDDVAALTDLSDVGVTTPTAKNVMVADGDSWESRALVEADISDLGTYLTAEDNDLETDGAVGILTTEVFVGTAAGTGNYVALSGDCTMDNTGAVTCDHDALSNFVTNEHIDWTGDQGATNIHAGNYTDTDDQTIDVLSFDGTSISISLSEDGEATKTLDISSVDNDTTYTAGRSLTLNTLEFDVDSEAYVFSGGIGFEDPTADDDFPSVDFTRTPATITYVWCESDQTVNLDLQVDDGTPADVIGTDIVCDATPGTACASGCDQTISGDATLAAGDRLDLAVTSVSGNPTWVAIHWEGTYDD